MRVTIPLAVVLAACGIAAAASPAGGDDGWKKLHRRLHVPHLGHGGSCPATARRRLLKITYWRRDVGYGAGPVYPLFPYRPRRAGLELLSPQEGGAWMPQRLRWFVSGEVGPVLVRGQQLDGPNRARFGLHRSRTEVKFRWPWEHDTIVLLRSGGCYAFQIDTANYSRVIVFQAKAGPPFSRIERLVVALRAAGAPLELSGSFPSELFWLPAQSYAAPGGVVQLFEFVDAEAARTAATGISSDGFSVGAPERGGIFDWTAPPHWFRAGAVLALYVGSDARILEPLGRVLGPQFAGLG